MAVRTRYTALLTVCVSVLLLAPAHANDSTAILESGQLQLTTSPAITLEREDLYLSLDEIRVRYRFRNVSNADVTTIVAFPLPEITVGDDAQYDVSAFAPDNFIGFTVQVNGKPVIPETQTRATRFGIDQTELLKRHSLRILPFANDFFSRLEELPNHARGELEQAGLVDWSTSSGANNVPLPNAHWKAHTVFYWTQTFPAGVATEVSHRYRPVTGVSFFGADVLTNQHLRDTYCMDKGFRTAATKRFGNGNAMMRELHYVLETGANWLGTIGEFHLTIDKGKPSNLVSLCIDGIRKTGPTTFEVVKKEFIPEQDLKVLVIEAAPRQ